MENMGVVLMKRTDIAKANIIKKRVGDDFITGYLLALGNQLRERMQNGVVEFYFHKKDTGEVRRALGTTMHSLVKNHVVNHYAGSSTSVIKFWDVEKSAWRSCQIQSLIKVC